jgi:uncharacterized protein (DUF362 family)
MLTVMSESKIRYPVRLEDLQVYDADAVCEKACAMMSADGVRLLGDTVSVVFCADRGWDREGVSTNPEVVIGIVEALARMGAGRIYVWDPSPFGLALAGSEFTRQQAFRLRGSARVVNSRKYAGARVKVVTSSEHPDFSIPKLYYKSDFKVYVPKAKTSIFTDAATSVALMLQLLKENERLSMHDYRIHQKLDDLFNAGRPDYVIYDALDCGEGQGPVYPSPRRLGLMVGGANAVNVDSVMCGLMGFAPEEIDHLRFISDGGHGMVDLASIGVVGTEFMGRRRVFRPAEWNIEDVSTKVHVIGGTKKYCAAGCVGFVRQAIERWIENGAERIHEPVNIILGQPIEAFDIKLDRERTLVIGSCASLFRRFGVYVPGCPPDPVELEIALLKMLGVRRAGGFMSRALGRFGSPDAIVLEFMRSKAFSEAGRVRIPPSAYMGFAFERLIGRVRRRPLE